MSNDETETGRSPFVVGVKEYRPPEEDDFGDDTAAYRRAMDDFKQSMRDDQYLPEVDHYDLRMYAVTRLQTRHVRELGNPDDPLPEGVVELKFPDGPRISIPFAEVDTVRAPGDGEKEKIRTGAVEKPISSMDEIPKGGNALHSPGENVAVYDDGGAAARDHLLSDAGVTDDE